MLTDSKKFVIVLSTKKEKCEDREEYLYSGSKERRWLV